MAKIHKKTIIHLLVCITMIIIVILIGIVFFSTRPDHIAKGSVIYIVPVYGQSLALGEEANLVTGYFYLW